MYVEDSTREVLEKTRSPYLCRVDVEVVRKGLEREDGLRPAVPQLAEDAEEADAVVLAEMEPGEGRALLLHGVEGGGRDEGGRAARAPHVCGGLGSALLRLGQAPLPSVRLYTVRYVR